VTVKKYRLVSTGNGQLSTRTRVILLWATPVGLQPSPVLLFWVPNFVFFITKNVDCWTPFVVSGEGSSAPSPTHLVYAPVQSYIVQIELYRLESYNVSADKKLIYCRQTVRRCPLVNDCSLLARFSDFAHPLPFDSLTEGNYPLARVHI